VGNQTQHIAAVTGLISRPDGKILMVLSPRRGWELPGGQVDQGESLREALYREVLEESGVIIEAGMLACIHHNLKPPPKLIFGFLGTWTSGELETSAESIETEWVERDQVLQRITHSVNFERTKDMLEFSGQLVYRVYFTDPYVMIYKEYI
jgi:8-oxo-dGTP diphosphatase